MKKYDDAVQEAVQRSKQENTEVVIVYTGDYIVRTIDEYLFQYDVFTDYMIEAVFSSGKKLC